VELCHNNGWRVDTYCMNPGMPVPQLSVYCSQTSPGVFWCGNGVQMLQQYAILETPGPQPSRTPTRRPTATSTFTSTPVANRTTQPQQGGTPIPVTATPYYRPQAGGPGNIEVGAVLLAGFALFAGSGWWLFRQTWGRYHR
jgi:hypothetical protein